MKSNFKNDPLITRDGNELVFKNLTNPKVVSEFIEIINGSLRSFNKSFILNFKFVKGVFPNVCVPLAGIIENLTSKGFDFEFYYLGDHERGDYLKNLGIKKPLRVKENKELAQSNSLDIIWRFESADDIYLLINSFVQELSRIIVCEKGVLEGSIITLAFAP